MKNTIILITIGLIAILSIIFMPNMLLIITPNIDPALITAFVSCWGLLVGAVLSLLTTIWFEDQRNPKLCFEILRNDDLPPHRAYCQVENKYYQTAFLGFRALNSPSKYPVIKIVGRHTAEGCRGSVQFHSVDLKKRKSHNDKLGNGEMEIRWSASPQPLQPNIISGRRKKGLNRILYKIKDDARYVNNPGLDLAVGDMRGSFAILAKYDNEPQCYGWSFKSYEPGHGFHNIDWEIWDEEFIAEIKIDYGGDGVWDLFRIRNKEGEPFQILPAHKLDYKWVPKPKGYRLNKK